MDKPLVSILIPTYNRPDYLRIALDSAINQTYKNIEIIVSDDSNNDLTKDLIDKNYPNVVYIKNKAPFGPIKNLNHLLSLAKGDYISFLMDDDLFYPNRIEVMMDYFLKYRDEYGITLVASKRSLIDKDGRFLPDSFNTPIVSSTAIINGKEFANIMLSKTINFIGEPTTPLFNKKDVVEHFALFGRDYSVSADMATWIQLLSKGNLVYITQPLSAFRIHSTQGQNGISRYLAIADILHQVLSARKLGLLADNNQWKESLLASKALCAELDLKNRDLTNTGDFFKLYQELEEQINAL